MIRKGRSMLPCLPINPVVCLRHQLACLGVLLREYMNCMPGGKESCIFSCGITKTTACSIFHGSHKVHRRVEFFSFFELIHFPKFFLFRHNKKKDQHWLTQLGATYNRLESVVGCADRSGTKSVQAKGGVALCQGEKDVVVLVRILLRHRAFL